MRSDEPSSLKAEAQRFLAWADEKLAQADLIQFAKNSLLTARSVAESLIDSGTGIPPHVQVDEADESSPRRRADIGNQRDSLLRMLAVASLERFQRDASMHDVIQAIGNSPTPVPPGLIPDRFEKKQGPKASLQLPRFEDMSPTCFAKSKLALLLDHLGPLNTYLEELYRFRLRQPLPDPHAPFSAKWLDAFMSAWTRLTAIRAGKFLADHGGERISDVINTLLSTHLFMHQSKAGQSALPTRKELAVRLEFWGAHLVCHAIESSAHPIDSKRADLGLVRLDLAHLGSRRSGDKTLWTGLNIGHVYMATWLARTPPSTAVLTAVEDSMDQLFKNLLTDSLRKQVAVGQQPGVCAAIAKHANPAILNRQRHYYDSLSAEPGLQPRLIAAGIFDLASGFLQFHPWPDPAENSIVGSIAFSWDLWGFVDDPLEWVDLLLLAHDGDWHAIPVRLDAATDDDRLDMSVMPELISPWGISTIRTALTRAAWIRRVDPSGTGVFLTASLELGMRE